MSENRNVLIVVNPAAGKSFYEKRLRFLEDEVTAAGVEYQLFYTDPDDKGSLRKIMQGDSTINEVFVMGGDGTLNYVVNEIQDMKPPISIVSTGTGNDSIKSLHGELDFKKQVDIALRGESRRFDLGICNGRYFVNGVGIGFDGEVVREMVERGYKKGSHIDYLLTVLRILAGFKEKEVKFSLDGEQFEKKILLMTISNGTTFGGGFVINPFAKPNDGVLDVCIFNEVAPMMRFWHLPKLKNGTHYKIKETEFFLTSKINIYPTKELVAHLDGEYIGHPPFDISIEKDALSIRTPA